jgi:hypothetical protein
MIVWMISVGLELGNTNAGKGMARSQSFCLQGGPATGLTDQWDRGPPKI